MRLQQHPRDAPPCAVRPAKGAALPAELVAPPAVLDAMACGAARVLRGLGARAGGAGAELMASTPDSLPLLGSHGGFEDGRVFVAAAAGWNPLLYTLSPITTMTCIQVRWTACCGWAAMAGLR